MTGKVVHFEVPASNVKRAQSFYKDVFDWHVQEMPEMNYSMVGGTPVDKDGMVAEPGSINGGMMKRTKRFAAPIITIQVDDIDASLEAIKKHGGKSAVKKTPIGEFGFSAYFTDPEGNLMGLFQPPAK